MSVRAANRQKFIDALVATGKDTVTLDEIKEVASKVGIAQPYWFTNDVSNKLRRGVYRVPGAGVVTQSVVPAETINMQAQVIEMPTTKNRISSVITDLELENIVPHDLVSIIGSNQFYPIFITGHSGNGKTMSIEQACAKAKRKFVCVSMTPETDESDLFGNYVLINGQMEWRDGPVTVAARQGAVLCIDEIDYGAQNLSSSACT
jgi:hypothetical protein